MEICFPKVIHTIIKELLFQYTASEHSEVPFQNHTDPVHLAFHFFHMIFNCIFKDGFIFINVDLYLLANQVKDVFRVVSLGFTHLYCEHVQSQRGAFRDLHFGNYRLPQLQEEKMEGKSWVNHHWFVLSNAETQGHRKVVSSRVQQNPSSSEYYLQQWPASGFWDIHEQPSPLLIF